MPSSVITSIVSFIGTNIDDIFILTLFFAQCKALTVVLGQYLGMGALVGVSLLGAFGLSFIPEGYIHWLGVIPILLGVKAIFDRREDESKSGTGVFGIALITVANGADNIGVYIPLFAGYSLPESLLAVAIFAVMTALWCFLGKKLASLPWLSAFLQKYKRVIVPVVFIALGAYILLG
ncbi:MAG: cadmium resistance transporter [Clostridia bacterium]|nr:cadmium resistance transporter [Clostridia bacterium]